MRFYKTGNDFAADIKRQIRAVRAAFTKRGQAEPLGIDGKPVRGPLTLEPRIVPVLTADGNQAFHEALTVDEHGNAVIRRVPTSTTVFVPVPARIAPREYHRLGGVS